MVEPILPNAFGLLSHRVQTHSATVPGATTAIDLTNPILWRNIKGRVRMGDRIDVVADDYSFHAMMFVTHSGSELITKLVYRVELEVVDHDYRENQDRYSVKLRGPHKWCIIDNQDGEVIQAGIPKQSAAIRWMEDHIKAMAA